MASLTPPSPLPPDDDRGPQLVAIFWTLSILSMLLVSLRFHARLRIHGVSWDDWMMLVSLSLLLLTSILVTYMASIGGARHVYYLSQPQLLRALKWTWISQPSVILLFATTKISIAILVLRLLGRTTHWRKRILYAIMASVFVANLLGVVFTFAQCSPARALWNPGMPVKCWDPTVQEHFNYFLGAFNILTDVTLALLPITFIPSLNLEPRKKIALCVLLGLGIIAAVFGGVKIKYLANLTQREDFTWSAYSIQAWSGAEGFVLIFCGNMPLIQPLWESHVAGRLRTRRLTSRRNPEDGASRGKSSDGALSGNLSDAGPVDRGQIRATTKICINHGDDYV